MTEVTLNQQAPATETILAQDIPLGQWFYRGHGEPELLFRAFDACPDNRGKVRLINAVRPNKTYTVERHSSIEGYRPVSRVHITTEG